MQQFSNLDVNETGPDLGQGRTNAGPAPPPGRPPKTTWSFRVSPKIWKFHPNGSGEICALFFDNYELSQLSSPRFMLWHGLRLSNVKLWRY
jgi:hypothetical protein